MNNQNYYFIKPYDESLPKPPQENYWQILDEMYLHPFDWNYRTTRKSFWLGALSNFILVILCMIIFGYGLNTENAGLKWIDLVVATVIYIWLLLAGLGQVIRRMHDVGYSGYWYWVGLFPAIGSLFLLYLELQPSKQTPVKWNNYLFTDARPYGEYIAELDQDETPEPSIRQIIKETLL